MAEKKRPSAFFVVSRMAPLGGAEDMLSRLVLRARDVYRPVVFLCREACRSNSYLERFRSEGIEVSGPGKGPAACAALVGFAAGVLSFVLLPPVCVLRWGRRSGAGAPWRERRRSISRRLSAAIENRVYAISLRHRLSAVRRQAPPAVVHSYGTQEDCEIGILWARARGIPVIHCEENDLSPAVTSREHVYAKHRILAISKADAIVVKSRSIRKRAQAVYGPEARVVAIPNWVEDIASACPAGHVRTPEGTVGCLGRFARLKGLHHLLESIRILSDRGKMTTLQLAGEGEEAGRLEELARELGVAGNVRFLGTLTADRLERFFSQIDAYVQPSLSESFGLAMVQAMSAGVPVVATTAGGIPDVVTQGETGILVRPGDATALADAIQVLLDSPALARKLGQAGRERFLSHFSERVVWPQWLELYGSLTQDASPSPRPQGVHARPYAADARARGRYPSQ